MTNSRQSRRSFFSLLTSLAGVTAIEASGAQAAAQGPASTQNWDLRWIDDLKGQHKEVFDMADADPAGEPPPLRLPRNYLDGFRDIYKLEFPEIRTVVGISGRAFPVNASDRLWEKYALGERSQIIDPVTKKPAVRNIFMDDRTLGVRALQARGTIFWQCNIAISGIAQQLAQARQISPDEVRADLIAGLNSRCACGPVARHGPWARSGAGPRLRQDLTDVYRSLLPERPDSLYRLTDLGRPEGRPLQAGFCENRERESLTMHRSLITACTITLLASAAAFAQAPPPETEVGIAQLALTTVPAKGGAKLTVTSPAFKNMADIPFENTQYRGNKFPGLEWTAGPAGTKSYAIIMQDTDAMMRGGPILHWTMFNIPSTKLDAGMTTVPTGASYGPNIRGANQAYMGPRTPAGPKHRYHLQVFALDTTLPADAGASFEALTGAMKDHVLASGQVIGLGQVDPSAPPPAGRGR